MNPVFRALVPALQVPWGNWWDAGSDDTWSGYGGYGGNGGYGGGSGGSWS
jgi:hypothetical protein